MAVLSSAWTAAEEALVGRDEPGENVITLADPKPYREKEEIPTASSKNDAHSGDKYHGDNWDDKRAQDKPEDKRDSKSRGAYY